MAASDLAEIGRVFLVGGGPGDPGMITLRAVECLGLADVILYDYLVNPKILRHATPAAERICLGRHGQGRVWPQEDINQRLVDLARQGKTIVRLKGGDPAVFARGAEEAEFLASHGVAFEIVPGITAALAAGSCAGIPITHRDMSSAVALITGQERPGKPNSSLDFDALARFPGTLVFYMGVTTAEAWTDALIQAGKSEATPTAIVRRCSFPDQVSLHCTLGEVAERLSRPSKLRPPVIVIIGEVTQLAGTLSWFEQRPLFGKRILVTRPGRQAFELNDRFAALGAEVLEQPAIRIDEPDDWSPVDDAISRIGEFDWLVFTSANGVRFFLDRLLSTSHDLRWLGSLYIGTIGPGTAKALAGYHIKAEVQAEEHRSESLAAALAGPVSGNRILYPRASRGRDVLVDELQRQGNEVESVVTYINEDVEQPSGDIQSLLAEGKIDWVTVTSSAIARSLCRMFGAALGQTRLASISPITSATLRELELEPAVEAQEHTMAGIVQAILESETDST